MRHGSTALIGAVLGALGAVAPRLAEAQAAETPEPPEPLESAFQQPARPEAAPCDLLVRDGPGACPRETQRRWRLHERELRRLEKVMKREGPDYSFEEERAYKCRIAVGAVFLAFGVGGVLYGVAYGLAGFFGSLGGHGESDGANDLGPPGTGIGTFVSGIVFIGIGIPLVISGTLGKNRQGVLRRKSDILAPFDPFSASISVFADTERGTGGLSLTVAF